MTEDDLDEQGLSLDELVARETEIRALHSADWPRWIAAKFEQTWWRYADVLLWIAFRSPERMAETLAHSYEPKAILRWYKMSAGDVAFHALQAIQNGMSLRSLDIVKKGELRAIYKPDVVETKPDEALRAALSRGAVRASGAPDGAPPRQIIDSDQWNSLDLPPRRVWIRTGPPTVDAAYTLAVPDILERGHWIDLRFDRESVMAAFPPIAAPTDADGADLAASPAEAEASNQLPVARKPTQLWAWLEGFVPSGERPTKRQVTTQARVQGWNVKWAEQTYPEMCDRLGFPRRARGKKRAVQ
jgi:hypothetical protein